MDKRWVGFDLDRTLAHYDQWRGIEHIGEPIPRMLKKLKSYLDKGIEVRIITSRASEEEAIPHVKAWCKKHIGQELEVTNQKDMNMVYFYDDSARQVIPNRGYTVEELISRLERQIKND